MAEALVINSTLTTLHLSDNKVGDSRRLVDAHLKRNKHNLKKKSASLYLMLLPLISLDLSEDVDFFFSMLDWASFSKSLL